LTVTYDSQGGSAIFSGSTTTGGSIASSPGTPTRSGYTFNGWFTASSGGSAITFSYAHGQTANFTLYAQWTATSSVTYNGNSNSSGSVPTDSTEYSSGASVTVAANSGSLAKTGYTFGGWCTTQPAAGSACGGTSRAAGSTFTISANTTLYAVWTIAAPSCATGGACVVGDTGPGGGIVFYVHDDADDLFASTGSDCGSSCAYLEAAPDGWGNSSSVDDSCTTPGTASVDPICEWSGNTNTAIGATAQSTDIGTGYANTLAAVGQSSTAGRAITAAWNYTTNGTSDWHLPSKDELKELCKYARTQTTGNTSTSCVVGGTLRSGFSGSVDYWSSTEGTHQYSWLHYFASTPAQGMYFKSYPLKVRPVRAFAPAPSCAGGGVCVVGDTGPGGGIVFYVAGSNFTSTGSDCATACRYLEAAPTDQSTGVAWATSAAACYADGSDLGTNDCENYSIYSNTSGQADSRTAGVGIGMGMANTNQIYARLTTAGSASTNAYAAGIAWAYTNNGKSDWHLPSRNELNELRQQAESVGGFVATEYWSSSEYVGRYYASAQAFLGQAQFIQVKSVATFRVRPVRAFG
jgi:uncharacterized repeat protein (TIGR02543 family)